MSLHLAHKAGGQPKFAKALGKWLKFMRDEKNLDATMLYRY